MKPDDIDPIGTFSSGNKFQKMATIHKEQEQSGQFYGNQRKIHFGGTPKMQYREGGKFHKPPRNTTRRKEGWTTTTTATSH
ncbi:unnamed protein product [Caenorhabditis brenneri]